MNVTKGWSGAVPNNMAEYCGILPSSERIDACIIETFVYEIWSRDGSHYYGWFPCDPWQVECNYVIWGRLRPGPPPPIQPDTGGAKISVSPYFAISMDEPYPNPFNSSVNINITNGNPTAIDLSAYDIMGRLVTKIFSGIMDIGDHTFTWNAIGNNSQTVPSGIYFIRLKSSDITKIRRVTLLK